VPVDFDVIIEPDCAFLPCRVDVGLNWQLLEGGTLDLIKQRAPAGRLADRGLRRAFDTDFPRGNPGAVLSQGHRGG
jgi:hypothetical protein